MKDRELEVENKMTEQINITQLIGSIEELKRQGWNPNTVYIDLDSIKFNMVSMINDSKSFADLYFSIKFYQEFLDVFNECKVI